MSPMIRGAFSRHHVMDSQQEHQLTTTSADDLIPEETETVQKALKRLPPKEAYDRVFRIRRAFQVRRPATVP